MGRCGRVSSPFILLRRDRDRRTPRAGIQESGDPDSSSTSLFTSCVALASSLSLSGPQLPHLRKEGIDRPVVSKPLKAGRPSFYVKSYLEPLGRLKWGSGVHGSQNPNF